MYVRDVQIVFIQLFSISKQKKLFKNLIKEVYKSVYLKVISLSLKYRTKTKTR